MSNPSEPVRLEVESVIDAIDERETDHKREFMIAKTARESPHAFGVTIDGTYTEDEVNLLERTRLYLAAIEQSTDSSNPVPEGALEFYHPDVRQKELPNRLVPGGAVRNLDALREAASRGRAVLRSQRYEVQQAVAKGTSVALETMWAGVLAVPVGSLQPGDEMRAYFAMCLEFDGDKIIAQRNYDCFEPF